MRSITVQRAMVILAGQVSAGDMDMIGVPGELSAPGGRIDPPEQLCAAGLTSAAAAATFVAMPDFPASSLQQHAMQQRRLAASTRAERALRAAVALAVIVMMVACGSSPKKPAPRITQPLSTGVDGSAVQLANAVLFRAIALVGTPYRWGGNTPASGFDCSGLVGYVFRDAAGVTLPRTSTDIARVSSPRIDRHKLVSGDLVFFGQRGKVNHVGIYVGDGRFVHAPNSGGTVRLDELDDYYWRDAWLYGKRVLR